MEGWTVELWPEALGLMFSTTKTNKNQNKNKNNTKPSTWDGVCITVSYLVKGGRATIGRYGPALGTRDAEEDKKTVPASPDPGKLQFLTLLSTIHTAPRVPS